VGVEDEHEAVLARVADVEQFGADAVLERAANELARLLAVVACTLGVRLPRAVPAYVGVKNPATRRRTWKAGWPSPGAGCFSAAPRTA